MRVGIEASACPSHPFPTLLPLTSRPSPAARQLNLPHPEHCEARSPPPAPFEVPPSTRQPRKQGCGRPTAPVTQATVVQPNHSRAACSCGGRKWGRHRSRGGCEGVECRGCIRWEDAMSVGCRGCRGWGGPPARPLSRASAPPSSLRAPSPAAHSPADGTGGRWAEKEQSAREQRVL